MNKDIIEGKWQKVKGILKHQWGKLTDDEIAKMKGTEQELAGLLQEKYGYEKDKAEKEIKSFIDKNNLSN